MPIAVQRPPLLVAEKWREYQLIDCGEGMKQEKWGAYTLVRPDPQVIWPRQDAGPGAPWKDWDGFYHRSEAGGGRWEYKKELPEQWEVRYEALGLTFKIKPTSFKHTGLFPEQAVNWDWIHSTIKGAGRSVSVLNLFGYTGAATCAAAAAGASVCHVDAAEGMVKWCRENAVLSGLADKPIRFIADDCLKFVKREVKRGRKYDAIIMDPPTYGRGSTGELWKLEDHLWELLQECRAVLTDTPLFFLINAYTARLSPTVVANLLSQLMRDVPGSIAAGEVGLPIKRDGKILPCGIYGRWEATRK
ncbi:MAG TPA: class I SAM-dependent methyltransferase [Opitutaceae bacterium]|jgi:23S rRNA (cytosine1962-C5)-methyltransferase|nr:class I SAM-dependent methyltransferase [Opitutaceae bacterium]